MKVCIPYAFNFSGFANKKKGNADAANDNHEYGNNDFK